MIGCDGLTWASFKKSGSVLGVVWPRAGKGDPAEASTGAVAVVERALVCDALEARGIRRCAVKGTTRELEIDGHSSEVAAAMACAS